MTKQEINKTNTFIRNINNVAILIDELLTPINTLQNKYNCTTQQAVQKKMRAEKYLTKYGAFILNATIKGLQNMTIQKPRNVSTNINKE